ncbi:MAG: SPOR domain-containing protein, partial [Stellaceae bacterium]
ASPVRVQLGSLRSPEAAREDWARLKRENPDLLGKLTAVAVRSDLGDKGIYYRVLAGSFGDAAAAAKLCGELKRRNLGCVLAR